MTVYRKMDHLTQKLNSAKITKKGLTVDYYNIQNNYSTLKYGHLPNLLCGSNLSMPFVDRTVVRLRGSRHADISEWA